ncbi:MAG: nucleotidyltransferase family protein [Chloroflexi bacterium]|nr:nucleotidyltransferase family protein [Chloroflexota bacterium]
MTPPTTLPIALLAAATLTGPAAAEAGRTWLAAADLERLLPKQFPLLPLAVQALEQAHPDHPWLPRLRGVHRRAWYANQLMLGAADKLTQALVAAGIPIMLADALPLALTVYTDRLRPIGALALIVPADLAEEACRVLADQGWQGVAPTTAAPCGSVIWATSRRFRSAGGQFADLHWHAAAFWPSGEMDAAAWGRARPITLAGRPVLALSAADQLARSCRTAILPGPAALIALADVAALLMERTDPEVDWPTVIELAAHGHIERSLLAALECLEDGLGIAAPPDVLARLRMTPVSPFEAREGPIAVPSDAAASHRQALRLAYAQYRRTAAARGLAPQPGDFLTFLQYRWGLASRREIPRRIAARFAQITRCGP